MAFQVPQGVGDSVKVLIPTIMFVLGTLFGFFARWLAGAG